MLLYAEEVSFLMSGGNWNVQRKLQYVHVRIGLGHGWQGYMHVSTK